MTITEVRRLFSAAKARGYFEEHGRGFLLTRIASPDVPFAAWLAENLGERAYENTYFPLAILKDTEAPKSLIEMVETYDPEREAVVAIEFEPGQDYRPEIVCLEDCASRGQTQ